jgi:hypothetical protein
LLKTGIGDIGDVFAHGKSPRSRAEVLKSGANHSSP